MTSFYSPPDDYGVATSTYPSLAADTGGVARILMLTFHPAHAAEAEAVSARIEGRTDEDQMGNMSWQKRLAVVMSVIWLALTGAISSTEREGLMVFLVLGVFPVAFVWGMAWVWSGFRRQRATQQLAPDQPATDEPVTKATLYTWVSVVLLAGGVGALYYALTRTESDPVGKIAYLAGFYFWVPILVYLVWKSTFKKRKGMGLLLSSVAFLSVTIYESHAMLQEADEQRRALSAVQTMMLKAMNGELVETAELPDAGKYNGMLLLTHDFLSRTMGEFQALNTAIEQSGLETMLSPETLEDSQAIDRAINTLEALESSINKAAKQIANRYDQFPRTIESATMPYSMKAEFKAGFERTASQGRTTLSEYFTIQHTFIATAIEMLQFMRHRKGRFIKQNDQILFHSQLDSDKYNEYLQTIQTLALQESEWRRAQLSSATKQIEQMDRVKW